MKKLAMFCAVVAFTAIPLAASAAPYGMAGCGLGSIVFGDEPGMMQTSAATTNGTFYSQWFGITSGTSNCVDATATASLDQEAFVKTNYAYLTRDAAQGQGEYLSAFATLLGCDSTVYPEFYSWTKENHGTLFNEEMMPAETLNRVKTNARSTTWASHCTRL